MRLTSKDEIRILLRRLLSSNGTYEHYPVGILKNALRGHMEVEVDVDQWPEPTSFVLKIKQDQKIPQYMLQKVNIYTQNPGKLEALLRQPGVLDWTKYWEFEVCSDSICQVMNMVAGEKGGQFQVEDECSYIYDFLPGPQSDLPAGYTLGPLTPDMANLVNDTWKYSQGELTKNYIEYVIKTFPSVCIYNPKGQPVAWNVTWHCMCMGMGYVLPEERGKGFANIIARMVAFHLYQMGDKNYTFVDESNKSSQRVMDKAGSERLLGRVWWGWYDPPLPQVKSQL